MIRRMLLCLAVLSLTLAGQVDASPSAANSAYSIDQLASSAGTFTIYAGLAKDGNSVYFGNFTDVRMYDLDTDTESVYANVPANANTGTLNKLGSDWYISLDLNYEPPYPSNLGTVNPADDPDFTVTMPSATDANPGDPTYSIYDATVSGGNLYFVATLGEYDNDGNGVTHGSRIYRYDTNNPTGPVEIANVGGFSGGLTFDNAGNLYYAMQDGSGVIMFTAAEVAAGGLTAADGDTVANVTAGGIDLLSDGSLVATVGGQTLAAYDLLTTGDKLYDIATTTGAEYLGSILVDEGAGPGGEDVIYVLSTDFVPYASTLEAITIPEPASIALLAIGGVAMLRRRR